MKTERILILLIFVFLLAGCGYEKLPPKTENSATQYVLPKGEIPTAEDREAVAEIRAEYETYIQTD